MFENLLPVVFKNFIDSIFSPPLSFLQMAIDNMNRISLIAGKGINLNHYFGFFSYLPGSLQAVVNSLLGAIIFLAMLQLLKASVRIYILVKDGVKWW
ncbi:hypothetical protein [Paenibacillus agricola]|uniref:Uncharacterized protein n=1 Tax=Paenibacillus agricola TaxID=2716264 RepID=A0ABX0JK98_9BACL|nr:hypothetical protein [Paenibacillus agricola]NHN35562.1 hypothetical protein [Paenibacillus agricola]